MNIQIFGVSKSFDCKKAERFFKERNIKFQLIDLKTKEMSLGELRSVVNCVGIDNLINYESDNEAFVLKYMSSKEDKIQKLYENQQLLKLPVVRNGKTATVGYCPEIWKSWS